MHPNAELINQFYQAFSERRPEGMKACYHADVVFNDPAFQNLNFQEVNAMWAMLIQRGTDLSLEFSEVQANDQTGSARWIATYTFSKSGNKVVNDIRANFEFKDGLIVKHTDVFNFHKWAGQALGLPGKLLGWTNFLQKKVQENARGQLNKYIQKHL
ncbi:MAG: nuclear transport factor 2 family protein [Bacteroidota bacterium]